MSKLCIDDTWYHTELPEENINTPYRSLTDPCEIRSIIPGTIVEVRVQKGQRVSREEVVILLEAMKMFNEIEAGIEGRINEIFVLPGDRVEKDQVLLRIAK